MRLHSICRVQALLEGISLSQPQPKLPSELIKFLGKTYNAWHIAIPLLESHVVLFPHVGLMALHSVWRCALLLVVTLSMAYCIL